MQKRIGVIGARVSDREQERRRKYCSCEGERVTGFLEFTAPINTSERARNRRARWSNASSASGSCSTWQSALRCRGCLRALVESRVFEFRVAERNGPGDEKDDSWRNFSRGDITIIPIELRNKHFVISKVFLFRGDYFSEFQKFLFLSIDIQ